MEIVFKIKNKDKKINIDNEILTLQSNNKSILENLIKDYDCSIIDNKDNYFVSKTVLEEINSYTKYPELSVVAKVMEALELKSDFFDREVKTLSVTEKNYLNILRNVAKISDIIVFKDFLKGLDNKEAKKIIKVVNRLKKDFVIIICSTDVNVLYELGEKSLIASDSMIKFDTTDEIYSDVPTLIKYKLEVPTLSYITYKAKKEKNVKLFYSKDVRDIIKDIYKHV